MWLGTVTPGKKEKNIANVKRRKILEAIICIFHFKSNE